MAKSVIKVNGMSCEHCVKAVTNAVSALPGVANVAVSLKENTATVEYDEGKAGLDAICAAIIDEGYEIG